MSIVESAKMAPGTRSAGGEVGRDFVSPAIGIRGVGLATALGADLPETWDALLRGEFITDHSVVPRHVARKRCRVLDLAIQTARESIADAGWTAGELSNEGTALIVGTSKGPVESWLNPPAAGKQILDNAHAPGGGVEASGLGEIAAVLARDLRLGLGPRLTVSAACASGLEALIRAVMMIRYRECKRAIVVAAESSLQPLFVASFQRLGVLASPQLGCRPFDEDRQGFIMSEAAAAVCLEARMGNGTDPPAIVGSTGTLAQVIVEQIALGGDATHLTGGDPDGATLKRLLCHVINGQIPDLVHAHGTGTRLNDPVELAAIEASLDGRSTPPALYSHKGALGHALGAAGLVAVVLNVLCHRRGIVPPNIQTRRALPVQNLELSRNPVRRPINRSVALAAGFGGSVAAISLKNQ